MFGFLFGTLCLIGLIKVARHGRGYGGCGGYGYGRGHGGGCGHRGHRGWHGYDQDHFGGDDDHGGGFGGGWGERARRYGGGRFFLRAMFQRLDTTPGQEKVIAQAFEDLREKGRAAKDGMKAARVEVAKAMRSTSFDEVSVGTATAQVEAVMDSMRKAGIDAFAKVHEALDERQRGMFADFIENGPRFRDVANHWRNHDDHGRHPNERGPYRYSV
ncbi:MAG: periplasmic heavy metal sensor [Polyangiaceae bacterium]